MKIPKQIKIGGLVYTIEKSEKVTNEGGNFGSTHHRKQRIFLDPSETVQMSENTFVHEILHAIWYQAGLKSRYQKDHPGFEEEVVDALSNGLYQVLKDNKMLK